MDGGSHMSWSQLSHTSLLVSGMMLSLPITVVDYFGPFKKNKSLASTAILDVQLIYWLICNRLTAQWTAPEKQLICAPLKLSDLWKKKHLLDIAFCLQVGHFWVTFKHYECLLCIADQRLLVEFEAAYQCAISPLSRMAFYGNTKSANQSEKSFCASTRSVPMIVVAFSRKWEEPNGSPSGKLLVVQTKEMVCGQWQKEKSKYNYAKSV